MEKSQLYGDRGKRRWRSFTKWMRRLRSDWNEHWEGWRPKYEYDENGVCSFSPGDPTQLCECFNLTSMQAIRFKDTPKMCSRHVGCGNPRRVSKGRNKEALTLQERVADIGESENWSKRKRRKGIRRVRVKCRCGYFLGFKEVPFGKPYWGGYGRYATYCEDCKKKHQ